MNSKREARLRQELSGMEADFREQLLVALRSCAAGRWGLFNQNNHRQTFESSGAVELGQLGDEIENIRRQLGIGEAFDLYARLIQMSGNKGSNHPGEQRLAKTWLAELEGSVD
jgi:hypothetical protein